MPCLWRSRKEGEVQDDDDHHDDDDDDDDKDAIFLFL